MRAILAIALIVTPAPALLAASADDDAASEPRRDRRVCTRIERQAGSRLSTQRVCLTASEWRDRLGPDWRQRLRGDSPEEDLDALETRIRDWSNIDGDKGWATGGPR